MSTVKRYQFPPDQFRAADFEREDGPLVSYDDYEATRGLASCLAAELHILRAAARAFADKVELLDARLSALNTSYKPAHAAELAALRRLLAHSENPEAEGNR